MRALRPLLLTLFALAASGCLSIPSGVFSCTNDADCPSGQSCIGGVCEAGSECQDDMDCGPGEVCTPGGDCIPMAVCNVDSDCPGSQVCGRGGVCTTTCATSSSAHECEEVFCFNNVDTVRKNQLCDGVANCVNDSVTPWDEYLCFSCPDGTPLHFDTHCDGFDDCGDRYDEASCFPCWAPGETPNGEVTKVSAVCDGTDQCTNGRDENDCEPFMCADMGTLDMAYACDEGTYADCADMSDEPPANVNCLPFDCEDGDGTIVQQFRCDGYGDCNDGSDEDPANCMVVCLNGRRLPPSTRCDLVNDCMDGDLMALPPIPPSDEVGCGP